jgi:DNA polymerase V
MNDGAFALVDCNNFFVSCERVFRPDLANKPVVVLSNNDGCVISRSNEAKKLGIRMGEPYFKIKNLASHANVSVHSCNFAFYGDFSWRVMRTLEDFAPSLEIYSIDEAFLDLSTLPKTSLTQHARQIRKQVKKWTGIPTSIGIAKTKTLAKIAAELAKTSEKAGGVVNLVDSTYLEYALSKIEVHEVWGIGQRLSKTLKSLGIFTALDLRNADDKMIDKHFNITVIKTIQELREVSCLPVEENPAPKKSIISSRSFGKNVTTVEELREAVATYAARAAEKLRREDLLANCLIVYIQTGRFRQNEEYYSNSQAVGLPVATSCTPEITRYAINALGAIFRPGCNYYRAGVVLSNLVPCDRVQSNLFDYQDREKLSRLMKTIDKINYFMGGGTLKYAAEGVTESWQMKHKMRTKCYTTKWSELFSLKV